MNSAHSSPASGVPNLAPPPAPPTGPTPVSATRNVAIPKDLARRAKVAAAVLGISLQAFIARAIAAELERAPAA